MGKVQSNSYRSSAGTNIKRSKKNKTQDDDSRYFGTYGKQEEIKKKKTEKIRNIAQGNQKKM